MGLAVSICAPFMRKNRWLFLFAGLGYSAALPFLSFGFPLLLRPLPVCAMIGLLSLNGLAVIFVAAIRTMAWLFPLSILDWLLPTMMWITYPADLLLCCLSGYGWYHRFRHPISCNRAGISCAAKRCPPLGVPIS